MNKNVLFLLLIAAANVLCSDDPSPRPVSRKLSGASGDSEFSGRTDASTSVGSEEEEEPKIKKKEAETSPEFSHACIMGHIFVARHLRKMGKTPSPSMATKTTKELMLKRFGHQLTLSTARKKRKYFLQHAGATPVTDRFDEIIHYYEEKIASIEAEVVARDAENGISIEALSISGLDSSIQAYRDHIELFLSFHKRKKTQKIANFKGVTNLVAQEEAREELKALRDAIVDKCTPIERVLKKIEDEELHTILINFHADLREIIACYNEEIRRR